VEVAGEEVHREVGADERGDAAGEHLAVDAGPNRSGILGILVARITFVAKGNENWMVSSCDSPRRIPATIVTPERTSHRATKASSTAAVRTANKMDLGIG
jgi:hypothetical protein